MSQALAPGGIPNVFAGEPGTRQVPLEEYVQWLEVLENAFPVRADLVERFTLMYHPSRFSRILRLDPSRRVPPMGLSPRQVDAWTSLLHTGYVEVPGPGRRQAVRMTAVWPALCVPRWVSIGSVLYWHGISLPGYTTWVGALQDVVGEWLRRRRLDATKPEDETDANLAADAGLWLQRALSRFLPREDLRGAIDAVVLSVWAERDPSLSLGNMMRIYYGLTPGPHPPDTPQADRRLDLFASSEPMLLWNGTSRTADSLNGILSASQLAAWALAETRDPAITPFVYDGPHLRPWFGAAMKVVSEALVAVLLHAGDEQRTLPSWPARPDSLYGGWDLRRGDNDATLTYAGQARPGDPGGHVARLVADLCNSDIAVPPGLGFTGRRDDVDTVFGGHLALLVREFQIEASQPWVRARSAMGWTRQPAFRRYRGRITGHLDRDTRHTLQLWLNRPDFPVSNRTDPLPELEAACGQLQLANGLTVFHASPGNHTQQVEDDLWWWDDVADSGPRVYARDHLRRADIPAAEVLRGDPEVVTLGSWTDNPLYQPGGPQPPPPNAQPRGGGLLLPARGSWASKVFSVAELLGAGAPFPPPGDPLRAEAESTFIVVYAMTHPESLGRLDVYNAWDRARMSLGLCHWTQGAAMLPTVRGELGALFALYKDRYPGEFAARLGSWGLDVDTFAVAAPGAPGIRNAPLQVWGLSEDVPEPSRPIPGVEVELREWLRSWRSIFRLLWLLRTDSAMLLAQWGLARWRIQGALAGRWSPDPAINTDIVDAAGAPATYGQILTSEAAVAAFMRYHINKPARVFPNNAENVVQGAIRAAAATAGVGLPTLAAALAANPAFAAAVVTTLIDPARDDPPPQDTIKATEAVNTVVPDFGRRPSRVAGSFQFWTTGI
ncbi:hypothetical protein [Streptomyces sp. NPDC058678]|uniref:hypothetical protein n=1 Tax=Streptomyces sp. NPDC058678 TaxID=3346595 RepID=UPI00364C7CA1